MEDGAAVLSHALAQGITFVDTAQMYGTYEQVRLAMRRTGKRPVIASKSKASSYEAMRAAVDEACKGLGLPYVDIFLLHASKAGGNLFQERHGAWSCLRDCRKLGRVRAIGVSTHSVEALEAAVGRDDVDIVFPVFNLDGRGIVGGSLDDMRLLIGEALECGKGVYLMKALGGGSLLPRYGEALHFCRDATNGRAAIAVGMVARDEVDMNLAFFGGGQGMDCCGRLLAGKSLVYYSNLCTNCSRCVVACPSRALEMADGHIWVDAGKCLRCGCCMGACRSLALRAV